MFCRSSCCRTTDPFQIYGETFHPTLTSPDDTVFVANVPNAWLAMAPHSALAALLNRSQSGTKFPRRGSPSGKKVSFHVRVVEVTRAEAGLFAAVNVFPKLLKTS